MKTTAERGLAMSTLLEEAACWTPDAIVSTYRRRLTDDLRALGPRPSWWRGRARRQHDRSTQRLKDAHMDIARSMLASHDLKYRAIMAHLSGWTLTNGRREAVADQIDAKLARGERIE